jgi:hypothetical protein
VDDERTKTAEDKDQAEGSSKSYLADGIVNCLLDLFVFADSYETTALRNHIMTALRTFCSLSDANLWPGLRVVPLAFELLPESSTFCQYFIDATAYYWNGTDPDPQDGRVDMSALPAEFTLAVCRINCARCFDDTGDTELSDKLWDPCAYHEHASEQLKKDCEFRQFGNEHLTRGLLAMCMAAVDATTTSENPQTPVTRSEEVLSLLSKLCLGELGEETEMA